MRSTGVILIAEREFEIEEGVQVVDILRSRTVTFRERNCRRVVRT